MSTGQRLRQVKVEIARIERFLPVMKRVLTMLRAEIRNYQERIATLEQDQLSCERRWQEVSEIPLASSIETSLEAEARTRPENLVGVDIVEVVSVRAHSRFGQTLVCGSALLAAVTDLAIERRQYAERIHREQGNLHRLEDAEEEFVFLINGSEQVRLPPLRDELARLARQMDEENGMAATIARLLRERSAVQQRTKELEVWQLLA